MTKKFQFYWLNLYDFELKFFVLELNGNSSILNGNFSVLYGNFFLSWIEIFDLELKFLDLELKFFYLELQFLILRHVHKGEEKCPLLRRLFREKSLKQKIQRLGLFQETETNIFIHDNCLWFNYRNADPSDVFQNILQRSISLQIWKRAGLSCISNFRTIFFANEIKWNQMKSNEIK